MAHADDHHRLRIQSTRDLVAFSMINIGLDALRKEGKWLDPLSFENKGAGFLTTTRKRLKSSWNCWANFSFKQIVESDAY